MSMPIIEWVTLIRNEYLDNYIRSGGAAVKFAVASEGAALKQIQKELKVAAGQFDMLFISVDAEKTRIHLMDQVFFEVARQIDWDDLTYSFLVKVFEDNGYRLPGQRNEFSLRAIAELNEREERFLRAEVQKWLEHRIYRDYQMCQEFRIAMIFLCRNLLEPESGQSTAKGIHDWLRGELEHIAMLKSVLIFQKVGRHNARHMLLSLAHWLKVVGKGGLILILNLSRYMEPRPNGATEKGMYYSTIAVIDAYEVLRQFIDGTDAMDSCLIVALAPPRFLTDDLRGVGRYEALKFRIWDDVRDRSRENPLAPLITFGVGSRA